MIVHIGRGAHKAQHDVQVCVKPVVGAPPLKLRAEQAPLVM
jgi:hypothetical protein